MLKLKTIKKTVPIFLCMAVIFTTIAGYANAEKPPEVTELIYSDNFESGELSDAYRIDSAKGTGSAEVVDDAKENTHGKAAYIHSPSESGGGAAITLDLKDKKIEGNTGKYLIEYDFLLHNKCAWAPYISLRASDTDKEGFWTYGTTTLNVVGIEGKYYSSFAKAIKPEQVWSMMSQSVENTVTTDDAKWHKASMIIDTTENVAEYFYDGIYVGKQDSSIVNGEFSKGIKLLQFQIAGDDVAFNMYIDNIHIGKVNPYISDLSIINYNGEKIAILDNSEIEAISDTITAEFNYTENAEEEANKIKLTADGNEVVASKTFDSETNKVTVKLGDYLSDGTDYSLEILDRTYNFTVKRTKTVISDNNQVKRADVTVNSLDEITVGDDLSAEFNILNTTDAVQNIKCYIVYFDGNLMKSVSETTVALSASDILKKELIPFKALEAENAKIYLFALNAENNKFLGNVTVLKKSTESEEKNDLIKVGDCIEYNGDISENVGLVTLYTPDSSNIHWINQVNINNDGSFEAVIGFERSTDKSGVYSGEITLGELSKSISVEYINIDEHKSAINELLKLKNDKNGFCEKLNEVKNALGLTDLNDEISSIYYNYFLENDVKDTETDKNINAAKRCIDLANINSGKNKNIFDDSFDFEQFDIYEFMTQKYFSEELKGNITTALSKKKIQSLNDLNDTLTECFVIELTKRPDGYENLYEPFIKFASKIGVLESDVTKANCKKVSGKSFENYSELKTALLKEEGGSTSGTSGSSSNSGKGKGSAISGNGTVQDQIKTNAIPKNIFKDVDDDFWALDAIVYLAEKGIVNGKTKDTFEPEAYVTREEFVKMIIGALYEEQENESESIALGFADIKSDEWYYPYIQKAFNTGIVTGLSESEFGVGENITREDMAVILKRAMDKFEIVIQDKSLSVKFEDEDMISDYALDAVDSLKSMGIIKGDGNMFNPKVGATRAETVMMLYRILEN